MNLIDNLNKSSIDNFIFIKNDSLNLKNDIYIEYINILNENYLKKKKIINVFY